MGTRSTIAIEKDGKVKAMYCHYDGYLEYNGKMLFDYYDSEEEAEALVNNGYASSLHETIEEINSGRVHQDPPDEYHTVTQMLYASDALFAEYIYLWRNGEWWVSYSRHTKVQDGYLGENVYYHSNFYPLVGELEKLPEDLEVVG